MNKKRNLINGTQVEELDEAVCLIIYTLAPQKWKIEDMETGQVYIGDIESHPVHGDQLKSLTQNAKIVQWKKV